MDENQFRILVRLLEQMLRTLRHIEGVLEQGKVYREILNHAPDGPAKPRGGPL